MNFENLIGNEDVKKNLNNAVTNENILHSYLFVGTEGIGKHEFAKEFAKMILCTSKEKGCNQCKSCLQFNTNNNPDFYEINLEESSIKIEQVRRMQEKILEKPIVSSRKVYIINDCDYMTKEAQNCLLKTLEEPPEYVTIILIASNENNLLTTIKSRCIKIKFNNIDENAIKKYIENELHESNISNNMLKACNGSIGKAIEVVKNKELYNEIEKIFDNVENYKLLDVINKIEIFSKYKENINEILEYINIIFFQKALKDSKYIDYIQYVEEVKKNLKANANYDMSIDSLLFNIWGGKN